MTDEKKKNGKWFWLALIIIIAIVTVAFVTGKVKVVPKEPDNYAPTVKYEYDTSLNSAEGKVSLVVGVEDKDGDKMNIQFYTRDNPSDDWVGVGNFEGMNGEYFVVTNYTRTTTNSTETAHWKIQVTDFKEYTTNEYTFKYD